MKRRLPLRVAMALALLSVTWLLASCAPEERKRAETPADCLVIEDADAGIEAASAGGFASAGIGDAASNPKATYGIKKFSELLEIAK